MCTALARRSSRSLARLSACPSATTPAPRPWPVLFLPTGVNSTSHSLIGIPMFNLKTISCRFGGVGDNQSVSSYRTDILPPSGDEISLRSLPAAVHQQQSIANHNQHQHPHQVGWELSYFLKLWNLTDHSILQAHQTQRSMSPVSAVISGEEPQKGRRSSRRRPHLEKQVG